MDQSHTPTENNSKKESERILKRRVRLKAGRAKKAQALASSSAVSKSSPVIPSHIERKHLLQTAFKLALTGGTFIDTKFYAFTRRGLSGVVDTPQAVFANSSILRAACPYFEGLLARGFEEGNIINIDEGYPSDRQSFTEDYDYDSDSDLEEEEEDPEVTESMKVLRMTQADKSHDEEGPSLSEAKGKSTVSDPQDEQIGFKPGRPGRVVHIPDVAHTTLKAFIFYLCTGEVLFRPLKSAPKSEQSPAVQNEIDHRAPPCSPKSMYRLADRYGVQALKDLCFAEIGKQLQPQNIVPELFSEFTSRYPPIRDFELNFITRSNISRVPVVTETLPVWIEAITNGSLPHCNSVLSLLLPRLLANQAQV
ncbi:hypothetical protein BXZ70DRAFT_1007060 [Cristinia sonorae]|uniref:BTB domain-containing protein n=1 Tax=Cristinia sonorae TaxID=1940300 RepID=A0A8K0XQY1_9AGAR|nr:hypothetical protein BXZ70DRAFT_1007060 [Cristinia sonorae]